MKISILRIHLCFILILNTRTAEPTISKSCQSYCGKISIPYPFGMGYDCYLNEWFEVQCNHSTSRKFVPFLPKINREVVNINLPRPLNYLDDSNPFGSVRIKTRITSMGCSGGDGENLEEVFNFTGSPFRISENNMLMAFGCNNKATLTNIDTRIVGCIPTCNVTSRVYFSEGICAGYQCCNATTPTEVGEVIGVKIESADGNKTRQGCNVAFLTDEPDIPSLQHGKTDPGKLHSGKYATIQLMWEIIMTNRSFKDSLGCGEHLYSTPCNCDWIPADDELLLFLTCACAYGYEGNPYIINGCKDIDECKKLKEDGRPEFCTNSGQTCQNIPGSYQCVVKKSKAFLIYIGVGIGLILVLVSLGIWSHRFIKKYNKNKLKKKFFKRNGGILLQQQMGSREGYIEKSIIFTSKELEKATESFSLNRVLGHGGQGTVFKGMLVDGTIVAVKKSKVVDEDAMEEFINEIVVLSKINHRNIVQIFGCCLETEIPLLVYEFIPNGTLFEHLHENLDDHSLMTWKLRLQIALDTAGAVSYLHSAAGSPIYHRDIKSKNIMLDKNYRAKVSDFGTSRSITTDHTHLTTVVTGTVGYVDPEYFQSSHFTDKSDVYSFGVVLVELITGEKPVSFERSTESRTLTTYFTVAVKENRLFDIIDSRIKDDCKIEQVLMMAKLAKRCLNLKGRKRPTMREVWMQLERISSSHGDSQTQVHTMEDDVEEEGAQVSFDLTASTSTSQYNVDAV